MAKTKEMGFQVCFNNVDDAVITQTLTVKSYGVF